MSTIWFPQASLCPKFVEWWSTQTTSHTLITTPEVFFKPDLILYFKTPPLHAQNWPQSPRLLIGEGGKPNFEFGEIERLKSSPDWSRLFLWLQRLESNTNHSILVVDDSSFARNHLIKLAQNLGFTSLEASDTNEALELLKNNTQIFCVISDYDMPNENGLTLLQKIRSTISPTLPFIGISAIGEESLEKHFLSSGAYSFFSKPLNIPHFWKALLEVSQLRAA